MSDPDSESGLWAELKRCAPDQWRFLRVLGKICFGLFIFYCLLGVCFGPINRQHNTWINEKMQRSRAIGLAFFGYANDHNGTYPDGNSSTEVFQKLLDGGYISDPSIFYIPFPGKTKPVVGQKLKPDNVSWDVTCCADATTSDSLPLVFLTGYKITYAPGGAAVPIIKPFPPFTLTWSEWWKGEAEPAQNPGIIVCYKTTRVWVLRLDTTKNPDGTIPNFVPADFDAKGKTYRQLTPDGPLK
jgi:hypothetical protein